MDGQANSETSSKRADLDRVPVGTAFVAATRSSRYRLESCQGLARTQLTRRKSIAPALF